MPATAASRLASSNTMTGALPPSSSDSFLMLGAHCAIRMRPTSVEPVKLSLRTTGLSHSTLPTCAASPVTTCNTPAGMPASCASLASANAVSGVCSAGLTMMVQPAASAGATLRVIIAAGKFHGVMAAHTPIGCFTTTKRCEACGACNTAPSTRLASSANQVMNDAA